MSLERILEPESMDTAEEAQTYDSMDHEEVNRCFVADLLAAVDRQETDFQGSVLDLGTGTALIPIELCRQHATAQVMAIDIAESMLARARIRVADAGLSHRIELQQVDSKSLPFSDQETSSAAVDVPRRHTAHRRSPHKPGPSLRHPRSSRAGARDRIHGRAPD